MHYRERPPPLTLDHTVRCLWTLEEEHTTHTEEHLFFPERAMRLVFYQGESYVGVPGGTLEALPPVYQLGFLQGPLRAVSRGFTRALGVEFYPWGAVSLLGLERVFDLPMTPRDPALEWLGRQIAALLRADATREALELLEDWLLARSRGTNLELTPATLAATRLYQTRGQGKISDLAEELGISPRQLERGFQAQVGLPAKRLARFIRFEEAHNRLMLEPGRNLTELAYALGYADQAHFNREFRTFAGMAPGTFAGHVRLRQRAWDTEERLSPLSNRSSRGGR